MIDFTRDDLFISSRCTLKECSVDNHAKRNPEYMTESTLLVYNFDDIMEKYINRVRQLNQKKGDNIFMESLRSNDSVYINKDGEIFFIEFKNGNIESERVKIRLKISESLLVFSDLIKEDISFYRQHAHYILVYNEVKNPITQQSFNVERKSIGNRFAGKGIGKIIRFKLRRFEGLYFNQVYTVSPEDFDRQFVKIWERT